MFERDIAPYLNRLQPEGIYSTMVKVCSIGESKAETMVADLMEEQTNPTLAPYAKTGEVHFRVTAKAADEETAGKLMEPMLQELKKRFGNYIFTMDENVTMEESIVDLLKEKQMTVTTAESCTGGLLSGRILNVPGASAVYKEGYITYSNEAKEKLLGVSHETLETYGAVSYETAREWQPEQRGRRGRCSFGGDGNCRTGRRNEGKTGRTCLYRVLCEGESKSRRISFYRQQKQEQRLCSDKGADPSSGGAA